MKVKMMQITRKFKRLEIEMETPQTTTGNGPAVGGKVNNLLKIGKIGKGEKTGGKYIIKGLRGWINHAMMTMAKEQGIEVCHTSEKTETQKGESLLPEGFHPTGKCLEEGNECLKHRLMGSFRKKSKLKFEPVIIVSTSCKEKVAHEIKKMHIATDNRNALVQGSKEAIQDFGQRYFAGKFTLKIELLEELTREELGFLLKAILYAPEIGLGAAVNNGSGRVKVEKVSLQHVERSRGFNGQGKVIEEEKVRNLWKEMEEGMTA
ncbi:MAG: hypothetical protein ACTSSK_00335 [Candidatus Heimdallarchaeota archaeon]